VSFKRHNRCRLGRRNCVPECLTFPKGPWIVVVLAAAILPCGCGQKTHPPIPPAVTVTVAKPLEQEIVDYAEFTGNTAAIDRVEIRARVSGYLAKTGFEEGALVKAGDVLFEIDPRPYEAALNLAQANLEQARAQENLAKSDLDRAEQLREKGVIDPQTYQTQLAALNEARADTLARQANLETAKLNLEFASVHSPINGRTSIYNYTVGNLIAGGDANSSGVLTSVVAVDPIYVYFNVDERALLAYQDIIREGRMPYLQSGKVPIEMQLANETNYRHKGYIDFVDNQVDPSTGTVRFRGSFPNKDGFVLPGLFAQVRLPSSPRYKAVLISDLAVTYDQGRPVVYVIGADNTVRAKPVKLGALNEGLRVAEEGVKPTDQIVVNGLVHLRPGVKVKPEEGKMTDFAGSVRRQISVAPSGDKVKGSSPNESTLQRGSMNPPPARTPDQPENSHG
jgi:RND family efflux transporter MFP subunit